MKQRVKSHSFLRRFYGSYLPYTEEFEQMYNIIKEEFRKTDNTIVLGRTFETLKDYHQAVQRDPDEIYRENDQVELPASERKEFPNEAAILGDDFHNLPEYEQQKRLATLQLAFREYMKYAPEMASYEVRDVTWREEAERLKENILGPLMNSKEIGRLEMEESVARAIQERLVNEIPADGFIEMLKVGFAFSQKYQAELKPGDPMLIK